jgi:ADP-ribosylglycohydrolase
MTIDRFDRIRGCLVGGAIGDALGAPIEFWSGAQIGKAFGDDGIQDFHPASFGHIQGVGLVTDDTQMTLFTVEGLMRAQMRWTAKGVCHPPSVVHHAYQRWLITQTFHEPPQSTQWDDPNRVDGWLGQQQWLYSRRAPGNTCLTALEATRGRGFGEPARNTSKGCGAVMRSAPFGLYRLDDAAGMAVECAALTHGHPTGQLASGAFATMIETLASGRPLDASVGAALDWLAGQDGAEETIQALTRSVAAAAAGDPSFETVQSLGEGWIAEEALAIGVYCALSLPAPDQVRQALALSVSHRGDSDSTGSICGNILGTLHGISALPADLVARLEGLETIEALATDLWVFTETPERVQRMPRSPDGTLGFPEPDPQWWERYPG